MPHHPHPALRLLPCPGTSSGLMPWRSTRPDSWHTRSHSDSSAAGGITNRQPRPRVWLYKGLFGSGPKRLRVRSPVPSHQRHGHCSRVLPPQRRFYGLSPLQEPCAGEGTRPGSALWGREQGGSRTRKIRFSNPPWHFPGCSLGGTPGLSRENTPLPALLDNCSSPAFQEAATLK